MPFIRGRYHINAIAGEALEAAREAEAALPALEHEAVQASGQDDEGDQGEEESEPGADKGPIHRVEIEAAELVPSHSGRAQRGYVAHVHREALQLEQSGRGFAQSAANGIPSGRMMGRARDSRRCDRREQGWRRRLGMPHVRKRTCLPTIMIW